MSRTTEYLLNRVRPSRMALTLLLAASIGMTGCLIPSYAARNDVIKLNNEGVQALNANNYQLAIQKLEQAVKLDPTYAMARDNLAIAYNNLGLQLQNNPQEAIKQFHKSLALNPGNTTTQQNLNAIISYLNKDPRSFKDRVDLGKQARLNGDLEGAQVEFAAALKIKDDPKLRVDLGEVYSVRGLVDDAIAQLTAAAKSGLPPADAVRAMVRLGQQYQAKKDLKNAIASYGEALKIKSDDREALESFKAGWLDALNADPTAPENHIGLGQAYQYAGDFGQAEAEYKQALVFDRSNQAAQKLLQNLPLVRKQYESTKHINAGFDLQSRKLYDAAIQEYNAALAGDPKNANIWVNIGTAYQAKGDFDNAVAAYNKALSLEPSNSSAQQGIKTARDQQGQKQMDDAVAAASNAFKLGKYDEALRQYGFILSKDPKDAASHFNMGATLQAMQRLDEAIAEYTTATGLDPANKDYAKALDAALDAKADPLIAEAVKKHQEKDYAAAIALYKQVLAIRPKNVSVIFNLAGAYYSRQQYPEAKQTYEQALSLDRKGQIDDLWLLGTIAENSNRGAEALDIYKKYLQEAPSGKYVAVAKARVAALTKNINDTDKIKSEAELEQIKQAENIYKEAISLQNSKQWDQAIEKYQQAIKLQSDEPAYPFGLGTLFQTKGDYALAVRWYQTALDLDKDNKEFQKAVSVAMELQAGPIVDEAVKKQTGGDPAGAIELYKQALAILPNNGKLWTNLASAYQAADDFNNARAAYQKAVSVDAKNESADYYLIAALDEHFGQAQQAIQDYQKYVQINPSGQFSQKANERIAALKRNPADTIKLPTQSEIKNIQSAQQAFDEGLKLQQAGNAADAISQYQQAVKSRPQEPAYWYALGTAFQATNDIDQALSSYRKAMELEPKNGDYAKVLQAALTIKAAPILEEAVAKHQAGDLAAAIPLYEQALQIDPNNAAAHTNAAAARQASDDFTGAYTDYQAAYKLDPKGQSEVLYFLGALDENFGRGQQALQNYRNYVTNNPKGQFLKYAQDRVSALSQNIQATAKLPTAAERQNATTVQSLFDEGLKSQQAGDYAAAIAKYTQLVQLVPGEPAYWYAKGTAEQAAQQYDDAITSYKKAVSLDAKNGDYARVLQQCQDLKAAPLVDEAVKKHTAGDLTAAIALYKEAMAVVPKNARLHTNLATALQATDDFSGARDEYLKALGIDPKGEVDNWYFIGILDENGSKGAQALEDYRKYLQQAPKGAYFQPAQARLAALTKNPNATQKLQTSSESKQLSEANTFLQEAIQAQQENKLDEAIAKYGEALKLSPNSDSIWYSKGTAHQAKNELQEALNCYQKAAALNAKEPTYKQLIKQVRQLLAAPYLESAYKKQTTKDAGGNLDTNGAIADYEAALKLDDDPTTRLNIGTAYQGMNNLPKALENYKKAVQLDPKQADAYYYMGLIYEQMKQSQSAVAEYRKYLQFAPNGQYAGDSKTRLKAAGILVR